MKIVKQCKYILVILFLAGFTAAQAMEKDAAVTAAPHDFTRDIMSGIKGVTKTFDDGWEIYSAPSALGNIICKRFSGMVEPFCFVEIEDGQIPLDALYFDLLKTKYNEENPQKVEKKQKPIQVIIGDAVLNEADIEGLDLGHN